MTFGGLLKTRREKLGLGINELSKLSKTAPKLTSTISPAYYSQIEGDYPRIIVSEIGIDKLWAIGYVLKINPISLFIITRRIEHVPSFSITNCSSKDLSSFLINRREELKHSLADVVELINDKMSNEILKNELKISRGYLSEIENKTITISKIEANRLWVLGIAYDVDPLLLYVLSRGLDFKLTKHLEREKLFPDVIELELNIDRAQSESDKITFLEGQKEEFELLIAKRNSKVAHLRKEKDNYSCKICGFKIMYNNKYVIECHHMFPIMLGERQTTIDDLISVCPTCHQIFHLTKPPLALEIVKQLRNSGNNCVSTDKT